MGKWGIWSNVMDELYEILYALLPWICLLAVLGLFNKLVSWARKRKGAAIAVGLLVQMFIPDPKVQETIQLVVKQKQQQVKKSEQSASPDPDKENSQ
jgi:hypothetical protein